MSEAGDPLSHRKDRSNGNLVREELNEAKKILAYEVTSLVHGKDEAEAAKTAAEALFSGGSDLSTVPTINLPASRIGTPLIDILTEGGVFPSKSEARRNISQGGVTLNEVRIEDTGRILEASDFIDGAAMVKRGKKKFYRLVLE